MKLTKKYISLKSEEKLSLEQSISCLMICLAQFPAKDFVKKLGHIGAILDKHPIYTANQILFKEYTNLDLQSSDPLEIYEYVLFTPNALRLIHILLILNLEKSNIEIKRKYDFCNYIYAIFTLANQIVGYLNEPQFNVVTNLHDVQNYYLRDLTDRAAAIGRSLKLYNNKYFNSKLNESSLEMDVPKISKYLFLLYSHVCKHEPARIENITTFNRIRDIKDRENIKMILDVLSVEAKNKTLLLEEIISNLPEYFIQDSLCRGKPFLKTDDLHICIRSQILIKTLCDFPHYFLFNASQDKEKAAQELGNEFGHIFESYIISLAKNVLGETSCEKYFYKAKKNKNNECGDMLIKISSDMLVFVEIKSTRVTKSVRSGSLEEITNKFIKCKGVSQIINNVEKYRQEKQYLGDIFPIIIFYEKFPEVDSFDKLVKTELEKTEEYKKYISNPKNHSIIWLNGLNMELILSAVKQGVSFEMIIQRLVGKSPSLITSEIYNFTQEKNIGFSLAPLFESEIKILSEEATSLLIKG